MNQEIQNYIKNELNLNIEENQKILQNKLYEIQKTEGFINELLQSTEKECWENWENQLKKDFPDYEILTEPFNSKYPKVGLNLEYKGQKFSASIEKDNTVYQKESSIYFGFGRHFVYIGDSKEIEKKLNDDVRKFLTNGNLMPDFEVNDWWYGYENTTFEKAYESLKELIKKVIPILEKNTEKFNLLK